MKDIDTLLVPFKRTGSPLQADCQSALRGLRTALLLLMMTLGAGTAWGQADYSGTYYIRSIGKNANNTNLYYLCPTKGWYLYKATNSYENDTDDDDDNGQPFLTTYKCKDGVYDISKAIWTVEKHPTEDCYYIIQRKTGRYIVSNGQIIGSNNANRMRVHLEKPADATALAALGDKALFEIATFPADNVLSVSHIRITPHSSDGINDANIYLVTNNGNYNQLNAQASKPDGPNGTYGRNTGGIISIYEYENNAGWLFEDVVLKPTITDNGNLTVTISNPNGGGTIYYTTDGTTPDESSPNPITGASGIVSITANKKNVINAIVVKDGISSRVETLVVDLRQLTDISSLSGLDSDGKYRLIADIPSAGAGLDIEFTGTFDGNSHTISGLTGPLFSSANHAVIKNVILDGVSVSTDGNAGAICNEADGNTRIYNCGVLSGSTVGGDDCVGGLVGLLKGTSRVINCYSYADIISGNTVGGIVGYNSVATTANNLNTMVMNCMFYGNIDIDNCTSIAPIYNGTEISNIDASGVGNYNYFWSGASYVQESKINVYNCALAAEARYLQRFEFFRHLLNSNRALAAWWATGSRDNKDEMLKWVMEPSQIGTSNPYPILKAPDRYPSVVNIDVNHSEPYKERDMTIGPKLTTLTVNIQMGSDGEGDIHPVSATIIEAKKQQTLHVLDKDPTHFNFNYKKVQLPFYNDVGTNNYRKDASGTSRVVTGWKIVKINGSETGTGDFTPGPDASVSVSANGDITFENTPYNFADRNNTNKDLYSVSNRVFNQGAYFDVPEGVTSITIEPYWAKCVYVSDANLDVVYNANMSTAYNVSTVGGGTRFTNAQDYPIKGENQTVYTTMGNAVTALAPTGTVYDNAIVLVGNVHSLSLSSSDSSQPYTIMSIDDDEDNEPDNSYILRFDGRVRVHPVRIDFLNVIGLGMAQKSSGGTGTYNFGIMQPLGWFEVTNTGLFRVTQLEYDKKGREDSPMILHGGVIEQWVTIGERDLNDPAADAVTYYHVGGNVWFKEFHIGVHQDKVAYITPHPPISVSGGDYDIFYLTGYYNSPTTNYDDNAECYINGGRFGKMAGTGMQGIGHATNHTNGNIVWQIDHADIDEFYGGGMNAAHIAEGNIYTVIKNSRVDQFCGGPKFGNMNDNTKVVTNASDCKFRTFFGAGYGGNSYNRRYPSNKTNLTSDPDWDNWVDTEYNNDYNATYKGVSTRIDYQYIPQSDNYRSVARLFVDYVCFSLATTQEVISKLKDCIITKEPLGRLDLFEQCLGNFYGGGSLGKVDGPVTSILTNCTVEGNVFGAGYSASTPTVKVMDDEFQIPPRYDGNLGAYLDAELPDTETYTWAHRATVNSTATAIDTGNNILYTTENLDSSNLGSVSGAVTLTLNGTTKVGYDKNNIATDSGGEVYGGGDQSYVYNATTPANASTTVNISGNTRVRGNVYGGGNKGEVSGSTTVNITD